MKIAYKLEQLTTATIGTYIQEKNFYELCEDICIAQSETKNRNIVAFCFADESGIFLNRIHKTVQAYDYYVAAVNASIEYYKSEA